MSACALPFLRSGHGRSWNGYDFHEFPLIIRMEKRLVNRGDVEIKREEEVS